jgi:poly(A) polymerase/tRNA nucleotidyltransferase (CCA-adding enzyme)
MKIPKEILSVKEALSEAGFEAYLVGGCVRDIILNREPKDWDIATDARPEEIQKIFEDSVYENDFGTVGVKTGSENEKLKIIEITTYRIEGKYSDNRHPDEVIFTKKIKDDLARRDFTINAMALPIISELPKNIETDIFDPFDGLIDLKNKTIKAVLDPEKRFAEDALRIMRAARFATELDFEIELNTRRAIEKYSKDLNNIAKERIRDELVKIIMSPNAMKGILLLEDLGILVYVLPELREGIGVAQNKHHIFTIFDHSLKSLDYAVKQNYSFEVRMASLLHDVGKPRSKRGEGYNSTFYQHEYIGARMAITMLDRLRFPKETIEKITHLIRYHMFYYNVGEISDAGVRRFIVRVGPENIDDLLKVREADRIGSGVKKAIPYKLRHLLFMIEKVKHDPLSPKMLKVNGDDIMKTLKINPGPRIGWILNALLEEVLDDPKKNEKEFLLKRIKEINLLSDDELMEIDARARVKKSEFEAEEVSNMKDKYFV